MEVESTRMRVRPNCPQTGEKRLWNQWLGLPFVAGWAECDGSTINPSAELPLSSAGWLP